MNTVSCRFFRTATAVMLSVAASACDWVDSAGGGSSGNSGSTITVDSIPLGGAAALNEETMPRILVARQTVAVEQVYIFDDVPLEQGALDACLTLDGFDLDRAASTLAEACSSDVDVDECRFFAQPDESVNDELAFNLNVPRLRAPIGLRHTLITGRNVVDEAGDGFFIEDARRDLVFCLISFNEAPDAENDSYVFIEGADIEVDADSGVLFNDSDDDDTGNEPLRVDTLPVRAPSAGAAFELREDGSFSYELPDQGITADIQDSFAYRVTDGLQFSTAEVSLRVVAINQAPVLLVEQPPVLLATVGEPFSVNLSTLFEDPEGLSLEFSLAEDLPDDGTLNFVVDGRLIGVPGEDDVGEYELTLIADDGENTSEVGITLIIESDENFPPEFVAGTVFNQTVDFGDPIIDVEPEFTDPEGDELTYQSVGSTLPNGLELDETTGVVSGIPTFLGMVGNIVLEASDSEGGAAESATFFIHVRL